jgi:hypothetical protein
MVKILLTEVGDSLIEIEKRVALGQPFFFDLLTIASELTFCFRFYLSGN